MTRPPAVAGRFYPAGEAELRALLSELTRGPEPRRRGVLLIAPHAGYVYSGGVAGRTYRSLELPERFIVVGPNHTGRGAPYAINLLGGWRTPLGEMAVDAHLARALQACCPLLEEDAEAHQGEHSVEVHLPFLQFLRPRARFVPLCIRGACLDDLRLLGDALARAVAASPDPVLLVASTDMTHYEPEAQARRKDRRAIRAMEALDAAGLFRLVEETPISMCGCAPTTACLFAARLLGARQAALVQYASSGAVTGDMESVVGYAGLAAW